MTGRLLAVLPIATRSLWRNPRRTIITLSVVAVGLWSILVFSILFRAWAASSRDATVRVMTGEGQIHAQGYRDDPTIAHRMAPPDTRLRQALQSASVGAYAERVRVDAIVQSEYKTLPVTLAGVNPDQERRLSVLPNQITAGRYLLDAQDAAIVLGADFARRLQTRVGKRVVVMTTTAGGQLAERAFRVAGLFAASRETEDSFAFTGLHTAQVLTASGDDISEIAFDAAGERNLPQLVGALRLAAPRLDVEPWNVLAPLSYAVSRFFAQFVMMWLLAMIPFVAIGIVNTQLMSVFERMREFGLLQALGMGPGLILFEVALESALLVGIGVAAGAALAFATARVFRGGLDLGFLGRGAEMLGAGHVLYPRVNPADFGLYCAMVWVLTVVAALWPARRAARAGAIGAMSRATA